MAGTVKYPIGIQTFSKIIEDGFVYVDKTKYVEYLAESPGYYFLSRPRRFGKSLLLSTLQAFFEGRRELFEGLDIATGDTDWTPRPVFMLSLNTLDPKSENSLDQLLSNIFIRYEKQYGKVEGVDALPQRFENLIASAHVMTGHKAVVLVDEYDAPLLSTIERSELNEYYRRTLRAIFSVLKSSDQHIHFAFITGVSRFSHTSLFSGANNLRDISFYDKYAGICGITEEELRQYLSEQVSEFATKASVSDGEAFGMLKSYYDGYHFCQESPDIYNPFSLLSALESKKTRDYWFQSGTPSYLIDIMKRDDFYLPDLECMETVQSSLDAKESYLNNPIALLFETGYVTIKSYDDEKEMYTLGLPNKEVAESFSKALMPVYSGYKDYECDNLLGKMKSAIVDGDAQRFMELLKTFLDGNPFSNTELAKRERYFKNNLYLVFRALGFLPRAEEETCRSRMDLMLQTRRFIYIFELKTDGNISDAMHQIDSKGYANPYLLSGKAIIKIAANYSSSANNIDGWEIAAE